MALSDNIKRLRLEKNLTQEQLAVKLGVSAQAVSKWETSETYPDGALLVPLANELEVSLDCLFGNTSVSMADISARIICLLNKTEAKERFNVAFDICWQIEKGLFDWGVEVKEKYDPDELKKQDFSSYVLNDDGFTVVSNGKEPFFSVFPQAPEGFGDFINDRENLQKIFAVLSHKSTIDALIYLYQKTNNYLFESVVLEKHCSIPSDEIKVVLDNLLLLKVIYKQELNINGEARILYYSRQSHKIIALFLMAREIGYCGYYRCQANIRKTPLLCQL